jgi:hypothetical protein
LSAWLRIGCIATGKLSDGTEGRFVFGNEPFSPVFADRSPAPKPETNTVIIERHVVKQPILVPVPVRPGEAPKSEDGGGFYEKPKPNKRIWW